MRAYWREASKRHYEANRAKILERRRLNYINKKSIIETKDIKQISQ